MGWLSLIKVVLSLANVLTRYARDRQLISAGEAKAVAKSATKSLEIIARAQAAKRRVRHDAASVQSDKFNTDNH